MVKQFFIDWWQGFMKTLEFAAEHNLLWALATQQ